MKTEFEFICYYGSGKTQDTGYFYNGWYCVDGSPTVNKTFDTVEDHTDVQELNDVDCFTWSKPIESLEELIEAVEF